MKNLCLAVAGICFLLGASGVFAQPEPAGFTLDGVYYYLAEGTEAAWGAHSLEPPAGAEPGVDPPGFTRSLEDIYYFAAAAFGQADAAAGDVFAGYVFFSTQTGNWGLQTGTIEIRTLSADSETVAAGFYQETTLSGVDGDLAMGNIKSGVTILGVDGTLYHPWPGVIEESDRFVMGYMKNGDLVTIDKNNDLMWASDGAAAGCYNGGTFNWQSALDWAADLEFAGYSDWRMPTIAKEGEPAELDALLEGSSAPYINETFFPNTVSGNYWSSVTNSDSPTSAWVVLFGLGGVGFNDKSSALYVRAVRGGE